MLRPSYAELMDILNQESEGIDKITSSYAIVIATSKRARQLVDGADALADAPTDKAVSIAVNEIYKRKIYLVKEAEKAEDIAPIQDTIALSLYAASDESEYQRENGAAAGKNYIHAEGEDSEDYEFEFDEGYDGEDDNFDEFEDSDE